MSQEGAMFESADCAHVLARVYEFIDNEVDSMTAEAIRAHLAGCEPCLDRYDVEHSLKALIARCCGGEVAPSHLRDKVLARLTVIQQQVQQDF